MLIETKDYNSSISERWCGVDAPEIAQWCDADVSHQTESRSWRICYKRSWWDNHRLRRVDVYFVCRFCSVYFCFVPVCCHHNCHCRCTELFWIYCFVVFFCFYLRGKRRSVVKHCKCILIKESTLDKKLFTSS